MTQIGRSLRSDLKPGPLPLSDRRARRIKRRANFTEHHMFVDRRRRNVASSTNGRLPNSRHAESSLHRHAGTGTRPHYATDLFPQGIRVLLRHRHDGLRIKVRLGHTSQKRLSVIGSRSERSDFATSDYLLSRLTGHGGAGRFLRHVGQRYVGAPVGGQPSPAGEGGGTPSGSVVRRRCLRARRCRFRRCGCAAHGRAR
jgi:hypothetical protein